MEKEKEKKEKDDWKTGAVSKKQSEKRRREEEEEESETGSSWSEDSRVTRAMAKRGKMETDKTDKPQQRPSHPRQQPPQSLKRVNNFIFSFFDPSRI